MPLVSVILPCHNAQRVVGRAVQSILNQTLSCLELIVVDDASSDSTIDVIKTFKDSRIKIIRFSINQGYPASINAGISIAEGKYIARMDADDECLPIRLEEQIKALEIYPQAAFCGTNRYRITPSNILYCDRKLPFEKYRIETWENLINNRRLFTDPSVLVEKEKVLAVGGYRTFQRSGMDIDLWLRLMERFGPCVTITTPIFGKRLEAGSLIFKPETSLLNQVPRVLARQRQHEGIDSIDRGETIDMNKWLNSGLIKLPSVKKNRSLFIGTAVTCLTFRDWKGFQIYFRYAWKASKGLREKLITSFEVLRKIIQRIRYNPYQRFYVPNSDL